jgi:plasmid maintenance system antidote protein VapI
LWTAKKLADAYSHFGEFMHDEMLDAGIPKTSVKLKRQVSLKSLEKIYRGQMGVGPETSRAFGNVLGREETYYMELYQAFKIEKASRQQV